MKTSLPALFCGALCVIVNAPHSLGAAFSVYSDRPTFEAALMGTPTLTQDFEGYPVGTDLQGISFLPGMFATSPFQNLQVFGDGIDNILFGFDATTRETGTAYYDFNFSTAYRFISFDVVSWDPAAPGPANVDVLFADGTSIVLQRFQTSGSESLPVFFGISSGTPITRIRWHETPEVGGSGNEEVAFDNFAIAAVPEPSASGLLVIVVAVLAARIWRRRHRLTMHRR